MLITQNEMNRNNVTRDEYLALAGQVANGLNASTGFLNEPDDMAQSVLERTDALVQKLNERFAQEDFEPSSGYYQL